MLRLVISLIIAILIMILVLLFSLFNKPSKRKARFLAILFFLAGICLLVGFFATFFDVIWWKAFRVAGFLGLAFLFASAFMKR